jgi:hypothetical protein
MKKKLPLTLLTGMLLFQVAHAQMARVQVIHNSADNAAAEVDVYINDEMAIDNFKFRTATPFLDLPAATNLKISIAPANSTSSADAIADFNFTLTEDETYIIVANGIVSTSGYSPSPAFDLYVNSGREAALTATNTDVLVFHGATDAPTVDIVVPGAGTIVDNISYGEFEGYLELATNNYTLEVRDESGMTVVASYQAPLTDLNLQGAALTILASGFLNPANNSNGANFGLFVALPAGGNLIALPITAGIHTAKLEGLKVYPNPSSGSLFVDIPESHASIELMDMMGRIIKIVDKSTTEPAQLDISGLSAGSYILLVKTNNTVKSKNIIKK